MNRKVIIITAAALALCGVLFYFYAGHRTPSGQPALAELTPSNFTSLENAFNTAKNEIRIVLLLSPT